ncbi:hypothetical protein BJ170DRAFT_488921 [Xylariales sp. AK1849]|nr:hypothetical protein BJ170DRAFT_488921 [Xylariales sp. AK1849]
MNSTENMQSKLTACSLQPIINPQRSLDDMDCVICLECVVCLELIPELYFPGQPPNSSCTHRIHVCDDCMSLSVESGLNNKGTLIGCPQCGEALECSDVQRYTTVEMFERYERRLLHQVLEQDPNFVWCSNGCGSGQLHLDADADTIVICENCGFMTNFQSQRPWHLEEAREKPESGETEGTVDAVLCNPDTGHVDGNHGRSEYETSSRTSGSTRKRKRNSQSQDERKRLEDEALSREYILEISKPCPKCKIDIQKVSGW